MLYEDTFHVIINKINGAIECLESSNRFIGVLDIPGFGKHRIFI